MIPEEEEYYNSADARGGGIPRVFVGSPYQRGHGIGSFLGGLFRKALPYLSRGVRAIGKEALRAGINVIDDVENNTPLKEALRNRFKESRGNLKRKAEEKIKNLMKGSGYKISSKKLPLQFPFVSHTGRFAATKSASRKRRTSKKKTSKNSRRKKKTVKRLTKKKSRSVRGKNKKTSTTNRRRRVSKKRGVSDIFS